jgi:hypothetical protein
LEYQQGKPTSRWAVTIFVVSLVSVAGFFLIVPSIIVFVAAIVIRGNLAQRTDKLGGGMASAAIKISGVSVLLGLATWLFMPSLGSTGRGSTRSYCSANLRGITQSMNVYAADGDWYPIVGASYSSTLASAYPGPTGDPDTLLSNKPGGLYTGTMPGNVCQSMWLLAITGQVAPKQFICRSDPAVPSIALSTVPGSSDYYGNFTAGPRASAKATDQTYSYSFAFMWTSTGKIGDWWRSDTDAGLPLIADMAPANGTGKPTANTLDGTNKLANSFNHQRDGQNIGYGDGHAEFARLANAGESHDNIFSANGSKGPDPHGLTPSSGANPGITGGAKGNWDVIFVPAADATGIRK